ncbi:MlaE family ABC transporter permease [Nocardioides daeguensis]|uniref:ABC transporter permease n=1 Tax=Nocardioides daeguensis TaxID=908359 RepID=A0ABP6VKM6_9ACTN|nr:ABC transporter permease [Nocardioides daeguensis]MBV6728898.1 ABC transporter permease [Nocardioides daeguensis]MCR1773419.1 ABC transporter permease [Nocardioides daeguensis]
MSATTPGFLARHVGRPMSSLRSLGDQLSFHGNAYAHMPRALKHYPKEVVRLLAEVALGSGALALIGGTVLVIGFLTAAAGIEVGLQAYTSFDNIGVATLSGFFSAYFNTREVAPIIAGIALTATVGAGFTAQIGAMRVSEEIDALEVMAVPPVPYLVTTRIIAGLVAVVPLFAIALMMCWLATYLVVTVGYDQAPGTYQHYFDTFLIPSDLFLAIVKVALMALVIVSICCYHGFRAAGGPAGVGQAVGKAVRSALISTMFIDLIFAIAVWGGPSVHIAG